MTKASQKFKEKIKRKKKEEHYTYPVRDVSHYIIVYSNKKDYGVSNLKLQKLLYFVQVFSWSMKTKRAGITNLFFL